jgi:MFS family permease
VGGLAYVLVLAIGPTAGWSMGVAELARAVGVGVGGLVAMVVAVVVGVWAGAISTIGQDAHRQSSFTWWVVNRLLFFAAITSIQGFVPFFLMYALHITREAAADLTGSLMMVVGLFTLVTALPGGWLSDRFGHKRLVGASGLIAAAGTLVLLGSTWNPSMTQIYFAGIILGLAAGLFTATNWALGTALAPPHEAGLYLGVSNLAGAGAGMIGAGMGGPMADFLNGYQPGLGYFAIFGCYGVLFVLSTVSLKWVKKG